MGNALGVSCHEFASKTLCSMFTSPIPAEELEPGSPLVGKRHRAPRSHVHFEMVVERPTEAAKALVHVAGFKCHEDLETTSEAQHGRARLRGSSSASCTWPAWCNCRVMPAASLMISGSAGNEAGAASTSTKRGGRWAVTAPPEAHEGLIVHARQDRESRPAQAAAGEIREQFLSSRRRGARPPRPVLLSTPGHRTHRRHIFSNLDVYDASDIIR